VIFTKRKFPSKYAELFEMDIHFWQTKTEDNFIIEGFNIGLHTCSFTHFRASISFGESRGDSRTLGGPEIPHDQQQSQIVLLAPHQDGTKQGSEL